VRQCTPAGLGSYRFFQKWALGKRGRPRPYDRYGFRVPPVIVSPLANKSWVCPPDVIFDTLQSSPWCSKNGNLPSLTSRDLWARTARVGCGDAGLRPGSILDALTLGRSVK